MAEGLGSAAAVFGTFLRLGLTSFGGPVAHLGYFRRRFVGDWLDEAEFAAIVGVCAFLPGPTSSQAGVAIGLRRAGWRGAVAAWAGFTLPSALLMTSFALAAGSLRGPTATAAVHGLKLAAVAIVAHAVIGMARTLAPDWPRRALALAAAAIVAGLGAWGQIAAIAFGALAGCLLVTGGETATAPSRPARTAYLSLLLFAVLLAGLPLLRAATGDHLVAVADAFYRAGAFVFGGGHVVLPLLRPALVPAWMSGDTFLAGYGAAQALPGPLFAVAAYFGTATGGLAGAAVATVAIFAPGMLLLVGVLPLWSRLQANARARAAVAGVNAAVVGVLAAALVSPVGTGAIARVPDAVIAATGLIALLARVPPWAVVTGCVFLALPSG